MRAFRDLQTFRVSFSTKLDLALALALRNTNLAAGDFSPDMVMGKSRAEVFPGSRQRKVMNDL